MVPSNLAGPFARAMALVSDDRQRCANVFGGGMEEILPCWTGRESAACADGRGNVRFHQKSVDSCHENLRLCLIGWSAVMHGVWVEAATWW